MGRGRRTALSAGKAQLSSTLRASSSSAWHGMIIYKVSYLIIYKVFHFHSNLSPVVLNTLGLRGFSYRIIDFDSHLSSARAFSSALNEMLKLMIFTVFYLLFKFQFSLPHHLASSLGQCLALRDNFIELLILIFMPVSFVRTIMPNSIFSNAQLRMKC